MFTATDTYITETRRATLYTTIAATIRGWSASPVANATTCSSPDADLVRLGDVYARADREFRRLDNSQVDYPESVFAELDSVRSDVLELAADLVATTGAARKAKARILLGEDALVRTWERTTRDDLIVSLARDILGRDVA